MTNAEHIYNKTISIDINITIYYYKLTKLSFCILIFVKKNVT